MNSKIVELIKTNNYKNGFVKCACGWSKELGDGFNQYFIDKCPSCSKEITTRIQNTVTIGKHGNYEVKHGHYVYFVIENGIHVQFSGKTYSTEYKSVIASR